MDILAHWRHILKFFIKLCIETIFLKFLNNFCSRFPEFLVIWKYPERLKNPRLGS